MICQSLLIPAPKYWKVNPRLSGTGQKGKQSQLAGVQL